VQDQSLVRDGESGGGDGQNLIYERDHGIQGLMQKRTKKKENSEGKWPWSWEKKLESYISAAGEERKGRGLGNRMEG